MNYIKWIAFSIIVCLLLSFVACFINNPIAAFWLGGIAVFSSILLKCYVNNHTYNNVVDVEYVRWLTNERAYINRMDIHDMTLREKGKVIKVPLEILEEWDFTGLSNVDFITSREYMRTITWRNQNGNNKKNNL